MSTRSRQLGNKYIKAEDIENFIHDSDEENPTKGLIGEEDEITESRSKRGLKAGIDRDGETEDKKEAVKIVDFADIDNQESGRLSESLEKWYGCSRNSPGNKLNNSVPKNQERKSVFNYFLSNNSEDNSGLKGSGNSGEDISTQEIESSEEESSLFQTVRKRTSPGDTLEVGYPKRFKVELDKEMDAPAPKPLKIELELEKNRRNEPIKRRTINTITEELDYISRRWKESYSRFKPSFQWGQPIIKTGSEKWDSHYFPQKIFEVGQKRLEGRYSSRIGETDYHWCDSQPDIVEARGVRILSDKVDEEGSEALEYEQRKKFSGGSNPIEDDLNTFNNDVHGRMTLRSGNQGRNRQDERISNEAGMSDQSKEKLSKKPSFKANKDNKKLINSNRQLEKCNDPHGQYQNEELVDSNKNFENSKGNYEDYGGSSQMNSSKSHYEENSAQGPMRMNEDDKVACPICEQKFEQHQIVSHATHCATEKYRD